MTHHGAWIRMAAAVLAGISLCSCSLRLPVEPMPQTTQVAGRASTGSNQPPLPVLLPQDEAVDVWLYADRRHSGMAFPYDWLLESGFVPPENFGNPDLVMMSWGNTDAYSPEGIQGFKWLQVLLTPTPSVLEATPLDEPITAMRPNHRLLTRKFPRDRGPALAHFLNQCSNNRADGRPVIVRHSDWKNGVQLEGRYPYFIPRVCNTWSAQAIETLGGEINFWRATTADGLIRQLENPHNGFSRVSSPPDN